MIFHNALTRFLVYDAVETQVTDADKVSCRCTMNVDMHNKVARIYSGQFEYSFTLHMQICLLTMHCEYHTEFCTRNNV